jgi:hypothetical protein
MGVIGLIELADMHLTCKNGLPGERRCGWLKRGPSLTGDGVSRCNAPWMAEILA